MQTDDKPDGGRGAIVSSPDKTLLRDALTIGLEARAIAVVISRCLLDQVELEALDHGFIAECSAALDASSRLMLQAMEIVDHQDLHRSKKLKADAARGSAA
ncbi:hypothetical protein [Rhizobium sp. 1399]|uniref:hypothetical protein n=1 Tax=Rhizobium sp. 1399 TaxID=2817758 RepID=UPI0028674491|nr:hypothetical protein [Rhizobium sp. 1399]MDR6664273.1 hypothetical protein [Rhizobium sp. 1399]